MSTENVYISTLDGAIFRSLPDIQPLPLVTGEQVWRLIRGNDGKSATRKQIVNEAALVMRWALDHGRGSGPPWELFQSGSEDEWTLGDARPLRVEAVSQKLSDVPLPKGRSYGRREQYPGDGLPAVVGSSEHGPWWVTVRFWWRGTKASAAWPALGFGSASPDISALGWTLDQAVVPDVKTADPGDKSWGKAKLDDALAPGTKAAQTLFDSLISALKLAAVVGGVYIGYRVYKDARTP